MKKIDKGFELIVAGSYRRGKDYSNDIDVLITSQNIKTKKNYDKLKINFLELFVNKLKDEKIIIDDLTDPSSKTKYMGFCKLSRKSIRRIDIRFVVFESYYSALLYFTGSYELNKQMRELAKTMNYKLNEYGLYKIIEKDDKKTYRMTKINSEKDIFKKLKLDFLEPNER